MALLPVQPCLDNDHSDRCMRACPSALCQILLVNGLNAGSRNKKEMHDRMGSMQLFSPLCLVPDGAGSAGRSSGSTSTPLGAAAGADAAQAALSPLPDADCMAALGWLAPSVGTAALEVAASAAGSCCALPPVRVRLREADLAEAGVAGAGAAAARAPLCARMAQQHHPQQLQQAQPADSQATLASAGAPAGILSHVVVSPKAGPSSGPAAAGGAAREDACWGDVQDEGQEEQAELEGPEWLMQGIAAVAERSQGSSEAVAGRQLCGRRWVLRLGGRACCTAETLSVVHNVSSTCSP